MSEIRSLGELGTGSAKEPQDPAARLYDLLDNVLSIVALLTEERDQARAQEEQLHQRLAAEKDRAYDLDRQLGDSQAQIRLLSEQLVLAREQEADSTRQLAVAHEQAAGSMHRLAIAQEQILLVSSSSRTTQDIPETHTDWSSSKQPRRRAGPIRSLFLLGTLVLTALLVMFSHTSLAFNPLPRVNHPSSPPMVEADPLRGATAKSTPDSRPSVSHRSVVRHDLPSTIRPKGIQLAHPSASQIHKLGAGMSRTPGLRTVVATCLHGCRAVVRIRQGVFVQKTFASERAYTEYVRHHHVFVAMTDTLTLPQPLRRQASAASP